MNSDDYIRIDRKSDGSRLYVYHCLGKCGKELKYGLTEAKRRLGYCVKCTKRKDIVPFSRAYKSLLYKANKYKQTVSITFEEYRYLSEIRMCFYCGKEVIWKEYGDQGFHLDRKDSSKDYTLDNVVVCCFKCNNIKSNFFESEEFKIVMKLHEYWPTMDEKTKLELWEFLTGGTISFEV